MQIAMDITMTVHEATARCLAPGMATSEVQGFIDAAHRKLGGVPASKAVQFGEATAYPHGVPYGQTLADGDMVLVDIGCFVEGYRSDITRTYIYGEPTARQREIWDLELRAQWAGFRAAVLGAPCEAVDNGGAGRDRRGRVRAGLQGAGPAAPDRAWHRHGCP